MTNPERGTALCLSGGGYRAMLFHLGALWRLNEAGYLPRLNRISSVSGGSITAGMLGYKWRALAFGSDGIARAFDTEIVQPLRAFAGTTCDEVSIASGLLLPGSIADQVTDAYRRQLFGEATLQALPDQPRFVINATNVQSGGLWRFSKPYMADYRVGVVRNPAVKLAVAVAASSAFPPVLSPLRMTVDAGAYDPPSGQSSEDLHRAPFTTDPVLTDGGVYDNLGLETAWKRYQTILVSDGGGKMLEEADPKGDWARHALRINEIIDNQVRSLRKRQVIDAFLAGTRQGTYWGIRSHVADYALPGGLICPPDHVAALAATKTRLKRMEPLLQERLINWGYAICDTAMRKWVALDLAVPAAFPFPASGVGA